MSTALIHAYTTGVLRARAEYAAHPFAACSYPACFGLRVDGDLRCADHLRHARRAARHREERRRAG